MLGVVGFENSRVNCKHQFTLVCLCRAVPAARMLLDIELLQQDMCRLGGPTLHVEGNIQDAPPDINRKTIDSEKQENNNQIVTLLFSLSLFLGYTLL